MRRQQVHIENLFTLPNGNPLKAFLFIFILSAYPQHRLNEIISDFFFGGRSKKRSIFIMYTHNRKQNSISEYRMRRQEKKILLLINIRYNECKQKKIEKTTKQ